MAAHDHIGKPVAAHVAAHVGTHRSTSRRKSRASKSGVIAALNAWYAVNGRHTLPWRKTHDQYRILISELMLQQTQVSRVVPKYEAFIKEFPTIGALANADRQAVLRQWQGLGYNSRAVRLHSLAKLIISEHGGRLPKSREELMRLPGIGPYTAGAMVIFSQRAPCASVDVNIERVIKRVFFSPHAQVQRKEIEELQLDLITRSKAPHHWHASIMDLGSAICTARNPACDACPLFAQCSTRGVRPDELRSAPKQSRFVNSTRWWRGQILKTVLPGPVPAKMLLYKIKPQPDGDDGERFSVALQAMIAEGIIERAGRNIRIAL